MHHQIRSEHLGNRSDSEVAEVIIKYKEFCDTEEKSFDSLGTWQEFLVHSILGNKDLSGSSNTGASE